MAAAALLLCTATGLWAQNTVTGTVTDATGEGVIGAVVMVPGTSVATMTNLDGTYKLGGVAPDATLMVSLMGYLDQSVAVDGRTVINFVLQDDTMMLEEAVAIGYGTTKKSNLTGAVTTVDAEELVSAGNASVGEMLRGRAAGMNITSNSAAPGASLNIAIRGGLSGAAPLIVVDGIPQSSTSNVSSGTIYGGASHDGGMININPDDIASINILKDASAAAIYGSDASGGVILITTKRGKEGRTDISYSGNVSVTTISDAPKFLGAKDFMTTMNEVNTELGYPTQYSQAEIDAFVGNGTDWLKEVTRTGVVNEHNLSVSSGSAKTRSLFSASYYDHQGIAKNNSMNRITGRLNVDHDFAKWLTGGVNASYSTILYKDVPLGDARQEKSALIYSAMTFIPTVSIYDQDGNFSRNPIRNLYPNPVSLLELTDQTRSQNLVANAYLDFKPFEGFSVKVTGGVDMKDVQADQYIPTTTLYGAQRSGEASKRNAKSGLSMINIVASYNKTLAEKHDLSAMAGWEYKVSTWEGMGIVANQFPTDNALYNNMAASAQEKPDISSWKGSSQMASFFGRVNYAFDKRYVITANLRVDGSSNFSSKHQWGVFPGVSLAWRINEEPWMKNVTWINDLKLRGGVGQTGNAGSLTGVNTTYTIMSNVFAPDGTIVNGMGMSQIGNPNLKWETLTDWNLGLDFGLWNSRLYGTLDFYLRERSDVILSKSLMSYHEIKTIDYNSGDIYRSTGVDLSLHGVPVSTRNFSWNVDFNISFYRNKTVRHDADWTPAGYEPYIKDWGDVYGWQTDGLIHTGEAYAHLANSKPGAIYYCDQNGYVYDDEGNALVDKNGRYISSGTPDGILDEMDYVKLFNSTPIPVSLNNTFHWKRWDLNIYIYGSLNGWRINDIRYQSVYGLQDITYGINALAEVKNRWTVNNENGTVPGVSEANSGFDPSNSDYFYEKSWYLRLDNVSLGYTLPTEKILGGVIKNARVYAAARNLYVLTPYKGMDPETGNGIGAYPNTRTFAIGLNLNF